MQPARIFLRHARKDTLDAGSLDTNTNARKRLFEARLFPLTGGRPKCPK
jgi:hypothetical protein